MQEEHEVGKWVTDGKHTYPYNGYLDALLANGTLHYCDKPAPRATVAPTPKVKSPMQMTLEERTQLADKLGIPVGDIGNMSPQELAEAEAEAEAASKTVEGFPG